MMSRLSVFLFLLICVYVQVCGGKKRTAPAFSPAYVAKGTLYIPNAEIREPFYVWYDSKAGSSRIDYYGAMVKTYQLSNDGSHGSSIKIVPMTTEEVTNKETCLKVEGNEEMAIKPQTIIPNTEGMECIGEEMVNGQPCEKWRLTETIGDKLNKYTLWIRYKKNGITKVKQPIPVKYEMRGFNSLLGSHYDHYYLDYDWYSYETPSSDVFQIADNGTCTSFPGPGDRHLFTFNPMAEFIHHDYRHVDMEFNDFTKTHGREYENMTEHEYRRGVFHQNLRFVHSINRANLGYQLGINHLADRTDLEIKALRGKQHSNVADNGGDKFPYDVDKMKNEIPESIDWRLFGAVTPVKDQSVCGSCWSFGTTGAVEGAYFMKHKKLVKLSQQALVDCSWGFGNNGCDGGEDFRAYQWIIAHGLPSEDDYVYIGQDGYCNMNNTAVAARMTGFVNVDKNNVDALKVAIAKFGPVSVAIDASHKTFSFYSNGVYYEKSCGNTEESLDHAVLAVGYGTMNGQGYWLVKNSWSSLWGNDGYVLMAQKNNNCGIMCAPTYAVVA